MSIKVVYSDETIKIKSIKVGTPVKRVTAGSFAIGNLGGVDVSLTESNGSILVYNSSTGNYEVANLRTDNNISLEWDSGQDKYTWGFTNDAITGDLNPDSDSKYDLGSSTNKWKDLHLSGSTINLGTLAIKDSSGNLIVTDNGGNKLSLGINLSSNNLAVLSFDSESGTFTFNDSDLAQTDVAETFHQGLTIVNGATVDSATITNLATTTLKTDTITNDTLIGSQASFDSAQIGTLRVSGNTVLDGNLTITGTETVVNTETINLADNTIVLNSNATGAPTENAGIEVERGDSANKSFLWNEANDYWTLNGETLETTGKVLFGNVYSTEGDLPSASSYHGMFAHVHGTGRGLFAHGGSWHNLIDSDTTSLQQVYNLTSNNADITNAQIDSATVTNLATTQLTASQATFDSANITSVGGITGFDATSTSTVRGLFSASGDLSYNSTTGVFSFDVEDVYTKSNFDSDLGDAIAGGTGITFDSSGDVISITNTGVSAGSYGSSSLIPTFTVNAQGQLTVAGTAAIAGVTATAYDSSNGNFSISTSDGATFTSTINLNPFTTNNLTEQGNLYYTDTRVRNAISATDAGGDGSFSYNSSTGAFTYTGPSASEVRAHFSTTGDLNYNSSTGVFSIDVEQVYSQANFDSDFLTRLATKIDSASIQSLETTSAHIDSATVVNLATTQLTASQATFDSANILSLGAVGSVDATTTSTIRGLFSSGGDLTYNSGTGQFTFDVESVYTKANFDSDLGLANTGQLPEGSNLYYTTTRADSDFDVRLATKTTANVAEGTNLYYTTTRADSDFDIRLGTKSTTNVSEGSNLYYTTARADSDAKNSVSVTDAGGDGSLSYNSATGVFTYTGASATETRAHFTANKGLSVTSGEFNIDSANVKAMFAGNKGLSYTDGTFDIDSANVKAMFSGGTGVTYSNGAISIGQAVGTTDNVTFGKVTQDSAVSKGIQFTPQTSAFSQTAGSLYFDSDHDKGLSVRLRTPENANPDVNMNIGQETFLYVKNETGAQIDNGDAVYIVGTDADGHPKVALARANTSTTGKPFGLATMNIPDNAHGWVTRYGLVRDVNTAGMTAGNILFLSADSAGVVTETPVTSTTGFPHHIGRVIKVHGSGGVILVDPMSEHFDDLRVENKLTTNQLMADSASLLNVQFDTTTFPSTNQPYNEGLMYYDNVHKTLNYNDDITGMVHEVGTQEHQRVFNNTGSTILKGSALYFSGNYTSGTIDVPTIGLADATDANAYNAQGIAALDIPNNSYGHCLVAGQLTEVNTAHLSANTNFFVSTTQAGSHQNASPTYPNFPMCLGWVVKSGDSDNGILLVNQQNHSVNSFRVRTSAHIGTDLQVDGNLTILGSQTTVGQSNVTQGAPIYRLNEGDAIGEAGTTFSGTGVDDAFFAGHFTGTTAQTYYVQIDGVGTGAGGKDTFAVALGTDSAFASPILTKQVITTNDQLIHSTDNISVNFGAATGHDSGDTWTGVASPINVDTGFFTNRNTGTSGVGYTHMGIFFDVTDEKWKLVDEYDSTPTGSINTADGSFSLATLVAGTFEGNLIGGVTGNASTASALASGQNFSISGDVTASNVSFDGTGAVTLSAAITADTIINADIKSDAAIADTKLATIATSGKVSNSATTATASNTGSAIIARDASGNFAGGTFTGEVNRDAQTTVTAGTYGSATAIPVLTIDSNGFVDSAGTIGVSGITGVNFDSSNGLLTIATSGDDFTDVITLDPFTTANLSENTNLYYTDARARASISGNKGLAYNSSTGVMDLDSANVRGMFSASGQLAYNSGTGAFTFTNRSNADTLTAIKAVDGASSGLDADLLDGQEGSHYRINVYNNSGTLLN